MKIKEGMDERKLKEEMDEWKLKKKWMNEN